MEWAFAAIVTSLAVASGVAFWQLLVRPEVILALWRDDPSVTHPWFDDEPPPALAVLRWTVGGVLFALGFLTGLAWSFLVG